MAAVTSLSSGNESVAQEILIRTEISLPEELES